MEIVDKGQSFFSRTDDKLELQNALRALTTERIEAWARSLSASRSAMQALEHTAKLVGCKRRYSSSMEAWY
jgi:hypothetical protein